MAATVDPFSLATAELSKDFVRLFNRPEMVVEYLHVIKDRTGVNIVGHADVNIRDAIASLQLTGSWLSLKQAHLFLQEFLVSYLDDIDKCSNDIYRNVLCGSSCKEADDMMHAHHHAASGIVSCTLKAHDLSCDPSTCNYSHSVNGNEHNLTSTSNACSKCLQNIPSEENSTTEVCAPEQPVYCAGPEAAYNITDNTLKNVFNSDIGTTKNKTVLCAEIQVEKHLSSSTASPSAARNDFESRDFHQSANTTHFPDNSLHDSNKTNMSHGTHYIHTNKHTPTIPNCKEILCTFFEENDKQSIDSDSSRKMFPIVGMRPKKTKVSGLHHDVLHSDKIDKDVNKNCLRTDDQALQFKAVKVKHLLKRKATKMKVTAQALNFTHPCLKETDSLIKTMCSAIGKYPRKMSQRMPAKEKLDHFACDSCSYVAKVKIHLYEHKQRVHGDKNFKCTDCGKVFGFDKDFNRHLQTHQKANNCCDICGKMYKKIRSLTEHRKQHEDDYIKPTWPCHVCHKIFSTKYVLAHHIKSDHLGIKKTYICPTCGKSFTKKNSYLQHANVHLGIKPYRCDICGKLFSYAKSLKEHRYMHTDSKQFECKICQKKFRQSSAMFIHMKIHRELKDYICSSCGKGFSQKQALVRHERIHAGNKPYCCELCKSTFTDSSILRRHMIHVHKKDPQNWQEDTQRKIQHRTDFFINVVDLIEETDLPSNLANDPGH